MHFNTYTMPQAVPKATLETRIINNITVTRKDILFFTLTDIILLKSPTFLSTVIQSFNAVCI